MSKYTTWIIDVIRKEHPGAKVFRIGKEPDQELFTDGISLGDSLDFDVALLWEEVPIPDNLTIILKRLKAQNSKASIYARLGHQLNGFSPEYYNWLFNSAGYYRDDDELRTKYGFKFLKYVPSSKPIVRNPLTVTAAVICHNYGHFLSDALDSILEQSSIPEQILVIDDASTDNTKEIAEKYPQVEYHRVEHESPYLARCSALRRANNQIICLLDADDKLPGNYIACGSECFKDPNVGVVYSDIQYFGESSHYRPALSEIDRKFLARDNGVHSAALVRRDAYLQSSAYNYLLEDHVVEDWFVWRKIAQLGWRFKKQTVPLNVRVHGKTRSHYHSTSPSYFERAGLALERIDMVLLLAGRYQLWLNVIKPFLENQTWPHNQISLHLVDNSFRPEFNREVRSFVKDCDYLDVRFRVNTFGQRGLADMPRKSYPNTVDLVELTNAYLYNTVEVESDYLFILEDDIDAPEDVIFQLMKCFRPEVATVSAPYRSRYDQLWIARDFEDQPPEMPEVPHVQNVLAGGIGCTIARKEVWDKWMHQVPLKKDWWDLSFFKSIPAPWQKLLNWHVPCGHLNEPSSLPS